MVKWRVRRLTQIISDNPLDGDYDVQMTNERLCQSRTKTTVSLIATRITEVLTHKVTLSALTIETSNDSLLGGGHGGQTIM